MQNETCSCFGYFLKPSMISAIILLMIISIVLSLNLASALEQAACVVTTLLIEKNEHEFALTGTHSS